MGFEPIEQKTLRQAASELPQPSQQLSTIRELPHLQCASILDMDLEPAELTRGIATELAAPVLQGQLMTAGELAPVWPDAKGNSKGQAIAPMFKSVPFAVRKDPQLYEYLALAGSIRMGQPRERTLTSELLEKILLRKR